MERNWLNDLRIIKNYTRLFHDLLSAVVLKRKEELGGRNVEEIYTVLFTERCTNVSRFVLFQLPEVLLWISVVSVSKVCGLV
jgi:hypothetical protein